MVGDGFEQSQHSISVISRSNQLDDSVDRETLVEDENKQSISNTDKNEQYALLSPLIHLIDHLS